MIIDLENYEISRFIKHAKRSELFINAKIPNAASFRISLFKFYLESIALKKKLFYFPILLKKASRLKIWKNFFTLENIMDFRHRKLPNID